MSIQGGPDVVTDGLSILVDAGNSKSYSGTGTAAYDLTNDLTVTLSAAAIGTTITKSFILNGSSEYLDMGSDIAVSPLNQGYTCSYWIKLTTNQLCHFNGSEDDVMNGNWIAIHSTGYMAVWDRTLAVWKYGDTNFSTGVWYNVVFVLDSGGTNMRFYVNAIREGGSHVDFVWTASKSALNVRYIGQYEYLDAYSRYMHGEIPLTAIYDRALTEAEILQNFNAVKGRFGL